MPANYWAGRIVLIGPYAVGLQDAYFTPIDKGEQMYGVEIQANIIQSFLEKNVKKEIPDAPQLAVVFVLCAASMVLFLNQLVLNASLSAGLLAVLCPVGTVNLYKVGFVTHPLWGAVGVAAAYVLAMVGHYGRTVRERQALALEQERIGAELELANRIQASALPKEPRHRGCIGQRSAGSPVHDGILGSDPPNDGGALQPGQNTAVRKPSDLRPKSGGDVRYGLAGDS